MAKRADWNKIKTEYITTDIVQRDLAKKYDVPYSTLRDRCRTDGWFEEKKRFRSKIVADAAKKIAKDKSEQLLDEYNIACGFIKLLEKSLENDDYTDAGTIDTQKVNQAANALAKFMEIKRIVKGHQTLQEKQAHELALRRLKLDEKRAQKDDSEEKEIKIVLSDEIKEWTV